jgi:kumamolisin
MNTLSQLNLRPQFAPARGTAPAPTEGPKTTELKGSACPGLTACQKMKSSDPNQSITVSVILNRPQELRLPSGAFQPMSNASMAKYSSTPGQVADLKKFAKDNGLSVASVDPKTRTIKLQGTAATLGKAFGVEMGEYKDAQGNQFRAYQGQIKLPATLGKNVAAVLGLENRPLAKPHFEKAKANDMGGGFTGDQVAGLYDFPKGTDGKGQNVAIIELGGGYSDDDMKNYFQKLGIQTPAFKAVGVDGAKNVPGGDPQGADGEVELDCEVAGAAAPGAKYTVYFAPNTEQGFVDAINQAAKDGNGTMSISWGAPENQWTAQGMQAMNNAFKDAAAQGINIFAASGDNGSKDGQNDGKNHADFPSSSPWTVGCGGTNLQASNGQISGESAWGDGDFGGAAGGGVSDVFGKPDYQKGVNVPAPTAKDGGRGVPDVAGVAAPETGYDVLIDGSENTIGGTSAVAPLWAGLAARLAQGNGGKLPFLNPIMYQNPQAFHDITDGNNGAFKAGKGWDPVTGLGSPDGEKLLAALKAQQAAQSKVNTVG